MNSSKKSILSSTSIIGGSSIIKILISILRSKAVALILGPSGTGFIAALQSSIQLIYSFSSLGINNSAVRDISKSYLSNNINQLNITFKSLRKAVIFSAILGSLLILIFAEFLSQFTFDTIKYTFEIRLLSIALFFNTLQGGHTALIQGMRRIKDLAKISILSSFVGTLTSLPFIYFFDLDGVAYFLISFAVVQYLISFYYVRKIDFKSIQVPWNKAFVETKEMIKLGFSFMGGSLVAAIVIYLIRVIIIKDLGLSAAGIYQAAFTLSSVYIGVILQAMGKDFYPRLTGVAFKPNKESAMINEQTYIGMILAAPGLIFTLALAPIGIRLLYTSEYIDAYPILQWMILGVFLRTISWPLGYFFVARAKGKIFFWTEAVTNILQFVLVFLGIKFFGLKGTGISFFLLYIFYTTMMYLLVKKESNFQWSKQVLKTILYLSIVFIISFFILQFLNRLWGSIVVCSLGVILTYFTLLEVSKIYGVNGLDLIRKFFSKKK